MISVEKHNKQTNSHRLSYFLFHLKSGKHYRYIYEKIFFFQLKYLQK